MMSHFKTKLILEVVDGGWQVVQPFIYHSELLGRDIEVPTGYVTDLASVPRLFRFIVPVANAKNRRAAVVHDYLCTHPEGLVKDQKQADRVFREALGRSRCGAFPVCCVILPRSYIPNDYRMVPMRLLILGPVLLALPACTQLNSLEITPEDNAMACLKGNTNAAGALLGASVSGITVELPASVDTSNWTAQDWKELAELCD
jgi:hypothetical protein